MTVRPDLDVKKVLTRRESIYYEVLLPWLHNTMDAADLQAIARRVQTILGKAIRPDVLLETLRPVAGREFHAEAAWALAWRLAANVPGLRAGRPAHPWRFQAEDEKMVWQVMSAEPRLRENGTPGFKVTIAALTGTYATGTAMLLLTNAAARYASARMGFTKRNRTAKSYLFHHPAQLVGLRVVGLTKKDDRRAPAPSDFCMSGPIAKWNRSQVLDLRTRKLPCPREYPHPCHSCAVGYDQCKAGTHPMTYHIKPCTTCGDQEALHDPFQESDRCLACTIKQRYNEHARKSK